MSVGIYVENGKYGKALNLEKKLKKKPNATIVETYEGELTEPKDLEPILNAMLEKYAPSKTKTEWDETTKLYHFKNKVNGHTIVSIHPNLDSLENYINVNDYERTDV